MRGSGAERSVVEHPGIDAAAPKISLCFGCAFAIWPTRSLSLTPCDLDVASAGEGGGASQPSPPSVCPDG